MNLEKLTRWLMKNVQQLDPPTTWSELSLVLLDDEGITPINQAHFKKNKPTDVISFTYSSLPGEEMDGSCGEVFVNVDRAVQAGPSHQGSSYELGLHVAHGCHHLTGACDDTPPRKEAMLAIETAWLSEANQQGLLNDLFTRGEPSTL